MNKIIWVNILILRSSLKARRRRKGTGRKGAVDILYFKKIWNTKQTKKIVSFASKWKTRNRKGIVWVYNTYSDINDVNEILWVNIPRYLYCAHPWKLEEEEEEEEEKKKKKGYNWYIIIKNIWNTKQKKTNEKEVIPWKKECLSLQSERQGTGRV